nr:unnamed protein product [Callosobruchus chinensis]
MPRNRFQLLLRMWHFSDNKSCPEGDRLYKVKPLLEKIQITEFREELILSLLNYENTSTSNSDIPRPQQMSTPAKKKHTMLKKAGPFDKVRKYCKSCYAKKIRGEIPKTKVKKVTTYCATCENQPHFCLECFNSH